MKRNTHRKGRSWLARGRSQPRTRKANAKDATATEAFMPPWGGQELGISVKWCQTFCLGGGPQPLATEDSINSYGPGSKGRTNPRVMPVVDEQLRMEEHAQVAV